MSRGEMFQEFEEKRRQEGFFPQVYKGVCSAMGGENIDKLVSHYTYFLEHQYICYTTRKLSARVCQT